MGYLAEYRLIRNFYGQQRAKRSGRLLMEHINEGIQLLIQFKQPAIVKAAFCLHPLVQNDTKVDLPNSPALPLAFEYARVANSYLCRPETDWITEAPEGPRLLTEHLGKMSKECAFMLLADKLQNQRDFNIYHRGTHARSDQLSAYFELWISTLLAFYIFT
jgi:hypothetical protein